MNKKFHKINRTSIFKMDGKKLMNLAKKFSERPKREFSPMEKFIHSELLPIAREVVCNFEIPGSSISTNSRGDEIPWIERESEAEGIVKKLVGVRPYVHNSTNPKQKIWNRKPQEILWIMQFLTDETLSSLDWEEPKDVKGFKFDPLTGIPANSKFGTVTRPKVDADLANYFAKSGTFLNTITLVTTYCELVTQRVSTEKLEEYLNYLSGDPNSVTSEGEDEPSDECMEEETSDEQTESVDEVNSESAENGDN
jgi:hypothetical protein